MAVLSLMILLPRWRNTRRIITAVGFNGRPWPLPPSTLPPTSLFSAAFDSVVPSMHPMQLRWLAFGFYFFQFGVSGSVAIPIVHKFAFVDSGGSEPTPFAVLPGQASAVLSSIATNPPGLRVRTTVTGKLTTITDTSFPVSSNPRITGRSPFLEPSTFDPGIVGAAIGGGILIFGLCLAKSSEDKASTAESSEEIGTAPDLDASAANRASWELYLTEIQSPPNALMHSDTMSTKQLYISNQVKRARQKELEIVLGDSASGSGPPGENVNPFNSDLDMTRASWKTSITQSPDGTLRAASPVVSMRQLDISNQVNQAREKVTTLEEMTALLRSSSQVSRASSTALSSGTNLQAVADTEPANSSIEPDSRENVAEDLLGH
ncbi:hypothetical protein B0H17DRAFT_1204045 [Mycena rosella]|uniref:Uncharacterized protein n=1 Tax=Mycena rosella TaxID=1033263 RepID=A0AAD7GGE8_MYCRO|nr:hypothetical protein B0H17DRAFT_1204045 [Mycena rosella]